MSNRDRLQMLRRAIGKGPGLSLRAWVEAAGVSKNMVLPSYPAEIGIEKMEALAGGAAKVLGWDGAQMQAWLLHGQDLPDLEEFLAKLPTLARCVGCLEWLSRDKVIKGVSRCHPCAADYNRQAVRLRHNPNADRLFDVAQQQLPQIRAKNPEFATALEECLGDKSRALTTARIQRAINTARAACGAMALSRLRADALMEEFGLKPSRLDGADRQKHITDGQHPQAQASHRHQFSDRRSFTSWARRSNASWRYRTAPEGQLRFPFLREAA